MVGRLRPKKCRSKRSVGGLDHGSLKLDGHIAAATLDHHRDTVQIVAGLFEGYTGVVQSISDDLRNVTVLVKRGRRDMPVELETSMIKPAD